MDANMSRDSVGEETHKTCTGCRRPYLMEMFFRRGSIWKSCNACSEARTNKRRQETLDAGTTSEAMIYQRMAALQLSQHQQYELMTQQQAFEYQQQQTFEMYYYQREQRRQDPRMNLDYLLADPAVYAPSPLEIYEQQRRMAQYTQEQQSELLAHELQAYPIDQHQAIGQGANQGMLQDRESFDPNTNSCESFDPLTNGEQINLIWTELSRDSNFEVNLANAVQAELFEMACSSKTSSTSEELYNLDTEFADLYYRKDSVIASGFDGESYMLQATTPVDVDMEMVGGVSVPAENFLDLTAEDVQAHLRAPTKSGRKTQKKSAPLCLAPYFEQFNAAVDLLNQPDLPCHDLVGEALLTQLISELSLSFRLAELHRLYCSNAMRKSNRFWQEVGRLDKLEKDGKCVPWGPLSDWLVLFENAKEELLDTYDGVDHDWKMENKMRGHMILLARTLKSDLINMTNLRTEACKEGLLKLFVEYTGREEAVVKTALAKQVRLVKAGVIQDCKSNGILQAEYLSC